MCNTVLLLVKHLLEYICVCVCSTVLLLVKHLLVYICVCVYSTVLLLVKRLLEYSSYADSLPMLINEIMTKLIDIIKVIEVEVWHQ